MEVLIKLSDGWDIFHNSELAFEFLDDIYQAEDGDAESCKKGRRRDAYLIFAPSIPLNPPLFRVVKAAMLAS